MTRCFFEFFRNMNHPHFSICAPVDVRAWLEATKTRGLRLTSSLVYLLTCAANDVPEFRRRLRGDEIVEHDIVHPSFTVLADGTDAFSFCEVSFDYHPHDCVPRITWGKIEADGDRRPMPLSVQAHHARFRRSSRSDAAVRTKSVDDHGEPVKSLSSISPI